MTERVNFTPENTAPRLPRLCSPTLGTPQQDPALVLHCSSSDFPVGIDMAPYLKVLSLLIFAQHQFLFAHLYA